MTRKPQSGLTLVELMITLSIVAILLSLSVPLRDMVMNNRRASMINEFVAAVNYTRTEAVTRGQQVSICRSADQATCSLAAGVGWEQGWIVFTDADADGVKDADPADPILKTHGAVTNITMLGNGTVANRVSFSAGGTAFTPPSNGTIRACDSRGLGTAPNIHARDLVIATGGRFRTEKATGGSCPNPP